MIQDNISIVEQAFSTSEFEHKDEPNAQDWAPVILRLTRDLVHMILDHESSEHSHKVAFKSDTSPATELEYAMETHALSAIESYHSLCGFWGEELGQRNNEHDYLLIIDPIDGTRSFLNGFNTYAITMTLLYQGDPLISVVANPPTGDMYFRVDQGTSCLTNCLARKNRFIVKELPIEKKPSPILNIHASLKAKEVLPALYKFWEQKDIWLIKSNSGSPALMIMETIRTNSAYINLWSPAPSAPYDLIAAHHISEGTNVRLYTQNGRLIQPRSHSGPFFCCTEESLRKKILMTIQDLT